MKNRLPFILPGILIMACQPEANIQEQRYCQQEIELLQDNRSARVSFDFNLSPEEQIAHLQSQVDMSLCRGGTPLNAAFKLDDYEVEALLMTDWYCVDSTNHLDEIPPPCFLIRSKQILINANGQVLVDGNLTRIDSISQVVAALSKDFFWSNSFKLVAYEILWDRETENRVKLQVFEETVSGYLEAANEISEKEYKTELCGLDSMRLQELQRKFRFAFLIEKKFPMPPPPPEALLEVVEDADEIELEIED